MASKDGGAAFPYHIESIVPGGKEVHWGAGMSLRDWFAGQALAGIMGAQVRPFERGDREVVAESAYRLADAMLNARTIPNSTVQSSTEAP